MRVKIKLMLIASLLFSACSQKTENFPILQKAQKDYLLIKEDKSINQNASKELYKSAKIYNSSKNPKDKEEALHLAFMLKAQIEIAKQSARGRELESKLEELKTLKTKALLDEKDSELLLLKKEAQKAKLEAKMTLEKLEALKELNAKQTNRGLVLTLGDVLFETSRSTLLEGSIRAISKLTEFLIDNPERSVLIEGHTDNVGSLTFNLDLSLRRSVSVEEALILKGVRAERLLVKGYGEMYPVASNDDSSGRQRNRRVEIVILEEGVNPAQMMLENR
jgi:outer membrane protein OmpA-like peptidoglycan-associated protein